MIIQHINCDNRRSRLVDTLYENLRFLREARDSGDFELMADYAQKAQKRLEKLREYKNWIIGRCEVTVGGAN